MTATPKETTYVSNIQYFGEPVYTYSLKQGIRDGFLAPYKSSTSTSTSMSRGTDRRLERSTAKARRFPTATTTRATSTARS
jgi:type I site-specific restriction endonuclease